MIRFAWRQFRLQAAIAFGALAVIAVLFVVTRPQLVHFYKLHETDALLNQYGSLENVVRLLLVVPALIGIFWGRRFWPVSSRPAPIASSGRRASAGAAGLR